MESFMYTKITEVNLSVFVYRLFHTNKLASVILVNIFCIMKI